MASHRRMMRRWNSSAVSSRRGIVTVLYSPVSHARSSIWRSTKAVVRSRRSSSAPSRVRAFRVSSTLALKLSTSLRRRFCSSDLEASTIRRCTSNPYPSLHRARTALLPIVSHGPLETPNRVRKTQLLGATGPLERHELVEGAAAHLEAAL
jgi:hypothetical protein